MQYDTSVTTDQPIKLIESRFSESDVELIERVNTFAEEYYHNIKHPVGKSYFEYATNVAKILADLDVEPIIVITAIILPLPHLNFDAFKEFKDQFQNECEMMKLVEEVKHVNQYELDIWQASVNNNILKERQSILRRMFLLAIEDTYNEGTSIEDEDTETFRGNSLSEKRKSGRKPDKDAFCRDDRRSCSYH